MGLLIYAQSISEKNLHRTLSFIRSKIVQHILTVVLDSLGISCLGFLTIIYPNRFWQWKWTRNEFGSQNYMGACSQTPCAAPRQRQMGTFYTWPYFSYWEVMQPNFLWRLVNDSYRLHNKFLCFFFFFCSKALCHNPVCSSTCQSNFSWSLFEVMHWSWSKSCALHLHLI